MGGTQCRRRAPFKRLLHAQPLRVVRPARFGIGIEALVVDQSVRRHTSASALDIVLGSAAFAAPGPAAAAAAALMPDGFCSAPPETGLLATAERAVSNATITTFASTNPPKKKAIKRNMTSPDRRREHHRTTAFKTALRHSNTAVVESKPSIETFKF